MSEVPTPVHPLPRILLLIPHPSPALSWRGTTKAEDFLGTPDQSHISPTILVYKDERTYENATSKVQCTSSRADMIPGFRKQQENGRSHFLEGRWFRGLRYKHISEKQLTMGGDTILSHFQQNA